MAKIKHPGAIQSRTFSCSSKVARRPRYPARFFGEGAPGSVADLFGAILRVTTVM